MGGMKSFKSGAVGALVVASLAVYASRTLRTLRASPARPTPPATPMRVPDRRPEDLAHLFREFPAPNARVGVNRVFAAQLRAILAVCIPGLRSKEVLILALHTIFLLLRTYLSVVVARIDGRIVRDLVAANGKEFVRGLGYWFAIALPATYCNSMIRYLQSKLSIGFRTRLMSYINTLYLSKDLGFYRLMTLDSRIEAPDQYIVTDVAKFCDALASLYSNVGKPLIDIIIFNVQLAKHIGVYGMMALAVNYAVTARLLRAVTPAFGRLAANEAKLEGNFRTAHTRLTLNAEEICFYHGEEREKALLGKTYRNLAKHVNSVYRLKIAYNMFEDFLIKYAWSAIGLGVCALPVFYPEKTGHITKKSDSPSEGGSKRTKSHTQSFITNKRLLLSLADAGGRIMFSYKEAAELAGFTSRVYSLLSVLHAVRDQQYPLPPTGEQPPEKYSLSTIHGTTIFEPSDYGLSFDKVDIVVPNPVGGEGQPLVTNLSLRIHPSEHLIITGANGTGKTSVARVVRGLWPIFEGVLHRPRLGDIFYIPQRPYLVIGSLLDNIIYPQTREEMLKLGRTTDELMQILELVHLRYLPEREGGWDTVKEWKDVLSGGEKQRVNIARLFYHRPKYAFLDECSSAVSSDVEGLMYNRAKEMGITLITISHRPSLFKYHHILLKIKDDGGYEITQIGTAEEEMSLEAEAASLEAKLRDLPKHKKRLEEINDLLGITTK